MEKLLFGAAYRPEPSRLHKDMALMERAGFNFVTVSLPEPDPSLLRRTLRAAEKQGLAVFAGGYEAGSLDGADIAFHAALARRRNDAPLALGVPVCGPRGELLSPGRLKLTTLTHIASGAQGVALVRWHSQTRAPYAPGVLDFGLSPGEIYSQCADATRSLARLSDKLAGLKKENRVAVLLSRDSETVYDALHGAGSYEKHLRRVCDSLYRLNVEYDILPDTQPDFSGYDLLAAPALCALSEELLAALGTFVENGGRLIACGQMGFADENLVPRAGNKVLDKLLGFSRAGLVDAAGAGLRSRSVGLPENAALSDLMELLRLKTALPLVTADHQERGSLPVVTVNTHGRGRAAYIAADMAPDALDAVLDHLLRAFRIPLPGIRAPLVLRRAKSREGRDLIFFLNHSPVPQALPYGGELGPWGVAIRENSRELY